MCQSWLPWETTTHHGLREMRMHAKSSTLIFSRSPHADSEDTFLLVALSSIGHSWSAAQHSPPLALPSMAHRSPLARHGRSCLHRPLLCRSVSHVLTLLGMRIGVGSHSGTAVSFSSEKAKAEWSKCFARCATLTLPLSL